MKRRGEIPVFVFFGTREKNKKLHKSCTNRKNEGAGERVGNEKSPESGAFLVVEVTGFEPAAFWSRTKKILVFGIDRL